MVLFTNKTFIFSDSTHYDRPFVFDPEHFSEKNIQSRHKYAFLGFGEGPRICLGIRLGLMQVRTGIASILLNFDVKVSQKTVLPLQFDPKTFVRHCKDGLWLNFIKRQK